MFRFEVKFAHPGFITGRVISVMSHKSGLVGILCAIVKITGTRYWLHFHKINTHAKPMKTINNGTYVKKNRTML